MQRLVVAILEVVSVETRGLLVEGWIKVIEDLFIFVTPRLDLLDRIPPVSVVHEEDPFPEGRDLSNPLGERAYVKATVDLVLRLLRVPANRPGRLGQDAREAGPVQKDTGKRTIPIRAERRIPKVPPVGDGDIYGLDLFYEPISVLEEDLPEARHKRVPLAKDYRLDTPSFNSCKETLAPPAKGSANT